MTYFMVMAGLSLPVIQCAKEEEAAPSPLPTEQEARGQVRSPVSSAPSMPRTTLPPPQQRNRPTNVIDLAPTPRGAQQPPAPAVVSSETGLFAFFPQQRIVPMDFKIGPLQDRVQAPLDLLSATGVTRRFLESLVARTPDYSLVAEENRNLLRDLISYPLSRGYLPDSFRIGKLAFEGDVNVRANIRLLKGKAVTEGEIYLRKIDEVWKVDDLQVGFTLLAREYQRDTEPFRPGDYRFLLE